MLLSLTLQNIAVIRQMDIQLESGLTAITGETGAGKSLLLDAIQLLFDKKLVAKNYLTHGESRACIESVWQMDASPKRAYIQSLINEEELGVNLDDETLILSREITATASRCRVNGTLTNMDFMARLGGVLLEMHGQHDLHRLFSPAAQRDMLDNFAGPALLEVKQQVKHAYQNWRKLETDRANLLAEHNRLMQERDFIAFQLAELESANILDPTEDIELEAERGRLSNVDVLKSAVQEAGRLLIDDDVNAKILLQKAQKALSKLPDSPKVLLLKEQLDSTEAMLNDVAEELLQLVDHTVEDPERLSFVVERLDLLARMKRKYGGPSATLQAACETQQKLAAQFETLENIQQFSDQLAHDCLEAEQRYKELATVLTELRRKHIPLLSKGILKELADLNLENARFDMVLQPLETPQESGTEQLQMMFSANPGLPLQPLDSVASGGELARVMLAIRLQDVGRLENANPVLIFDEIDAGLSGEALKKLAEKLLNVAKTTQVLVVTHQPLLAGAANYQWHLVKQFDDKTDTSATHAFNLAQSQARKMVLAQMASGELTGNNSVAQKFAASLLG